MGEAGIGPESRYDHDRLANPDDGGEREERLFQVIDERENEEWEDDL